MKETMKRKTDLFGLMISTLTLHAGWLYCLWACVMQNIIAEEHG